MRTPLGADSVETTGTIMQMKSLQSAAKQAAEKGQSFGENSEKQSSGAEARDDFAGFTRGINPPPPSVSSSSAACKAHHDFVVLSARLL